MTFKTIVLGILRKCFHTTIYKLHYLRMEINEDKVKEEISKISIPVKELEYADFLLGDEFFLNEEKLTLYRERLKNGKYKAYGVFIDGKLVYSSWVSFERIGMPVEIKPYYLAPNEGYLEDDYCMPEYRGRGLHTQVLWYRLGELLKAGKDTAIITIMDGNKAALGPAIKCGFKDENTFLCGLLFGNKYNTYKR